VIQHVVLFRFRADAGAARVAEAGQALRDMQGRIPEIRAVSFGPNLGPSARDWPHVLVVSCDDMDAVHRYSDHPVHRETVERYIAPIRDARLAVDVET
jgi:hypothetical protein